MIISGLTIIRDGIQLEYPFIESIRSVLPLCDEFIVVAGKSEDGTLAAVQAIGDPKISILQTTWSEKTTPKKCVLAQQTNIGLHLCRGDWVVYLQANEVLHEQALPALRDIMEKHVNDKRVEALLLERLSFWGDYNHVLRVYPHRFKFSPRIVRPYIGTYSIRDAMSFAVFDGFSMRGRYPRAVDTGQDIFRYGTVGAPAQQLKKETIAVHKVEYVSPQIRDDYFYTAVPKPFVARFNRTHPAVMADRIKAFQYGLDWEDPRWRLKPSAKEYQRIFETWFYEKFGVPRIRSNRYSLIGDYMKKDAIIP